MTNITITLDLNEYLHERMLKFCKNKNIIQEELIVQCLQHCESKNYF